MLKEYSSKELSEWLAYYSIVPMPQERDDLRAGNISALTFNANRNKDSEPLTAKAFTFDYQEPEPEKSLEERVRDTRAAMSLFKINH